MKFTSHNILEVFEIIILYFPIEIFIKELKEVTNDPDLENFPEIQGNLMYTRSLSFDDLEELSKYFYNNYPFFIFFIKRFALETNLDYLDLYKIEKFLEDMNNFLNPKGIQIKNFKIQKKIEIIDKDFLEEDLLFIDIETPSHILDYYKESLICLINETFRSSILFSIFSFEAGLKYIYWNKMNKNPKKESLCNLIKWAKKNNILDDLDDEITELISLKNYRNALVHCNPLEREHISSEIAENRAVADLNLINQSLNSIFN
jgi:hypothetical protein